MDWLREAWSSLFPPPADAEGRDIDRIWEMLDYLRDQPYEPAPGSTRS